MNLVDPADRKTYGQMCALAMAMDRVGDRWTVLILRELLAGPARFGELRASLPGIATNLLTNRLREMADDGLVDKTGTGQATRYELTDTGAAIRPALEALGQWGHILGPRGRADPVTNARSFAMPLTVMLTRAAEAGAELGDEPIHLEIAGADLRITGGSSPLVESGAPEQPAAVVRSTIEAMSALLMQGSYSDELLELVDGDPTAVARLSEVLAVIAASAPTPAWAE